MATPRGRATPLTPTGVGVALDDAPPAAASPTTPAQAPQAMTLPLEITFLRPRPVKVILVGAGGTGARLAPDIVRLLGRGDTLIIADPDTVEERNLLRQHFVRRDVGRYKAEVVAGRASQVAGPGVTVEAQVVKAVDFSTLRGGTRGGPAIFVGAVDNRTTRMLAAQHVHNTQRTIWLDAGNELRGGQVGIIANAQGSVVDHNTGKVIPKDPDTLAETYRREHDYTPEQAQGAIYPFLHMNTLAELTPLLLQPDVAAEAAEPTCGLRIDTQSLAANVMAYACLINILSRILDGIPFSTAMAFFSTANTITSHAFMQAVGVGAAGPGSRDGGNPLFLHTGKAEESTLKAFSTTANALQFCQRLAKPLGQ